MREIEYPACLREIAEQISHIRRLKNAGHHHIKKYDRGHKNAEVELVGILGELIFLHFLTINNIEYKMVNLVDNTSSKDADFIVNSKRLDVKSRFRHNYSDLTLNLESHKKSKGFIDYYIFIIVESDTKASMYKFPYNEVEDWAEKRMTYSDVKYSSI
jgi:hypothetical protein